MPMRMRPPAHPVRRGLPIRFQVAEGLAKAGPQLIKSLLSMEGTATSTSFFEFVDHFSRISQLHPARALCAMFYLVPMLIRW